MRNLIVSIIIFIIFSPLTIYIITLQPKGSEEISSGLLYLSAFVIGTLLFSFLNIAGIGFQKIIIILSERKSKEIYFSLISYLLKISKKEQKNIEAFLIKYYKKDELKKNIEQINYYKKTDIDLNKITNYLLEYKPIIRVKVLYELITFTVMEGKYLEKDDEFLRNFAKKIKIPEKTFERIKAMFVVARDNEKTEEQKKYYFYTNTDTTSKKIFAYKILGLRQNATKVEIKKAYHHLAKIYHPDKIKMNKKNDIAEATEMFQKISAAYITLTK